MIVAAVPTVGIVVGSEAISSFLFGSADLALAVVFVGIALLAGILHFVTLGVLRATGRPITYAALEGGALIANAMLAIAATGGLASGCHVGDVGACPELVGRRDPRSRHRA